MLICFIFFHFSYVYNSFPDNKDFIVIMLYKYMLLIPYFMFLNFWFMHSKFENLTFH